MKTTMIAGTMALLTTAGTAVAGEPMLLTDAQLDRVTAGGEALATLVVNKLGATPSPNTADNVSIVFGRAPDGTILELERTAIIGFGSFTVRKPVGR